MSSRTRYTTIYFRPGAEDYLRKTKARMDKGEVVVQQTGEGTDTSKTVSARVVTVCGPWDKPGDLGQIGWVKYDRGPRGRGYGA